MKPLVGIIMGSTSDWDTMRHAAETLKSLSVPFETRIVSQSEDEPMMMPTSGFIAGV